MMAWLGLFIGGSAVYYYVRWGITQKRKQYAREVDAKNAAAASKCIRYFYLCCMLTSRPSRGTFATRLQTVTMTYKCPFEIH